ncbi:MAG: sulfurtransferase TusA family protein [bacterium]
MDQIDARGLSCPQPVVVTMNKMKRMVKGGFQILVDTTTAKENIVRMASNKNWKVEVREDGKEFLLTISNES